MFLGPCHGWIIAQLWSHWYYFGKMRLSTQKASPNGVQLIRDGRFAAPRRKQTRATMRRID